MQKFADQKCRCNYPKKTFLQFYAKRLAKSNSITEKPCHTTRLFHNKSIVSRGNHSRDNSIITMQLALAKLFIGHLLFQASFYNYIEQIIKERTNTHNIFKGIIRHSILIFFSKLHSSSPHPINSFSYSSHFKNSPNFSVYGISNPSNIFSTVVISDLSSIIRL